MGANIDEDARINMAADIFPVVRSHIAQHGTENIFDLYKSISYLHGSKIAANTIDELIEKNELIGESKYYTAIAEDLLRNGLLQPSIYYYDMAYKADCRCIIQYALFILNNCYKEKGRFAIGELRKILPRVPQSDENSRYYINYLTGKLLCLLATSESECVEATKHLQAAFMIRPSCTVCISAIQNAAIAQYKLQESRKYVEDRAKTDPNYEPLGLVGVFRDTSESQSTATAKEERKRVWHIANQVKYFPNSLDVQADYSLIIDEIAKSAAPAAPIFTNDSVILTVGSCFANNFRKWLLQREFPVVNINVPEHLNNTLAIRGFFDWTFTNNTTYTGGAFQVNNQREIYQFGKGIENTVYRDVMKNLDGIIITYGVGEVWRDKVTGDVFWHAIPQHIFDENRHEAIISESSWNVENMLVTIALIREHIGDIPIVLTLSPVPLNATFLQKSIWEGDCASKSVLRTALAVVLSKGISNVYYWPAFEMVRWTGSHLAYSTFSWVSDPDKAPGYSSDAQHPKQSVVKNITDAFYRCYFQT